MSWESLDRGQSFIDAYFATYSGVQTFIADLVSKTEKLGYATTILGRRRYIPTILSGNKTEKAAAERVAVNTPIQGSAADIVKLAMIRVDRALVSSSLTPGSCCRSTTSSSWKPPPPKPMR
jgi:DNA polymerase-1